MNILYTDSLRLPFGYKRLYQFSDVLSIEPFESADQAADFFNSKLSYDLLLYNPGLFEEILVLGHFEIESFLSQFDVTCIAHCPPGQILPVAGCLEQHVIEAIPAITKKFTGLPIEYLGTSVLVTGAGGSIGSELVLQLLDAGVSQCICLDLSEFSIFSLKQKLHPEDLRRVRIYVGSYGDMELLEKIFSIHSIDLVINAAAYKHVSIMEDHAESAFNNNVNFFVSLLKVMNKYDVKDIIQVSTDKAASPSNIMGFTKFLCEQVLINASDYFKSEFHFSIVRFGNVVGSSGSVVPIFLSRIKSGQHLTVTHEEVRRFMMGISDAVSLILLASRERRNHTYVLDMGEPKKIVDVAKRVLVKTRFEYASEMIRFVGLQRGEKLTEQLFTEEESLGAVVEDGIYVLKHNVESNISKEHISEIFDGRIPIANLLEEFGLQ